MRESRFGELYTIELRAYGDMVNNKSMMCLHCSFESHLYTIPLFTMKSFLLSVIKIISLMILAYMGYRGSTFDIHFL